MPVPITEAILDRATPDQLDEAFAIGAELGSIAWVRNKLLTQAWRHAYWEQAEVGMIETTRRLLTEPDGNHKLSLGVVPSYGLTLYHHVLRTSVLVGRKQLIVNACPWAGECVKLCVVNNNRGRFDSTKAAWEWRTNLLVKHPVHFALLLGWALAVAVRKSKAIMFRPNVNSDVEWESVLPALTSGAVFGDAVSSYGYSKNPAILDGNGWVDDAYRVAYSWHEGAESWPVRAFVERGGSLAVVTNRRYDSAVRAPIRQWGNDLNMPFEVVDGDLTDEWILRRGVIGDLAFKPESKKVLAAGLAGRFVVKVYEET